MFKERVTSPSLIPSSSQQLGIPEGGNMCVYGRGEAIRHGTVILNPSRN